MDTFLQQLEQRANQISQLQSGFSEMTQLATELQMYIGLREIEKTTSQAATYIDALTKGDMFDEKNLNVTLSPSLLSILQDVKSFGDININTSQSTLKIKGGRKDQAQNLALTYPGFEEIKPTILRTLTIPDNSKLARIAACRILPDGNYIILNCHWLEDSGHLLLFRIDGIFTRKIVNFTDSPNDTCFVRKNTVAVTLGSGNQTILVDIKKNKTTKRIKLSHDGCGVASDGQVLVVGGSEKSTLINLNDMSRTILNRVRGCCIMLFKGNIYSADHYYKNLEYISGYKKTGEPLWTFKHHDIDSPLGIALDKNGVVYIASHGNNSIVVISPDGQTCKTILSEAYGIQRPRAIHINRDTGMMIVSNGFIHQLPVVYKL